MEVIVCDGFIGNVVLKISEGAIGAIASILKEALSSTLSSKVGYALSGKAFQKFKKRVDYTEYGGAPLLGSRAFALFAMADRTPTPSRMPSAWRRNFPREK